MEDDNDSEEEALIVYENPLVGIKEIVAKGIPDNVDLSSLFRTDEGKRFANQVKSQSEFTLVGILFPLLFEIFGRILPKVSDLVRDQRFKDFYKEQMETTEDLDDTSKRIIESLPDLAEYMFDNLDKSASDELENEFDSLFGFKAKERFLGNMVFSLHSYLQAYIDSIIESLIRNDSVRRHFLEYWESHKLHHRISLVELDELSDDKYEAVAELVKRSISLNLVKRMNIICTALGCQSDLSNLLNKLNARKVVDEIRFLCDQRNEIAHGNPAPDITDYGIEMEEFDWNSAKKSIIEEVEKVWTNPPETVYAIIEFVCDWAEDVAAIDYFALLDYLPKATILYPAVFDFVIYDAIKKLEEESE
ncbi:MAG: hypothetical protein RTU92_07455 [Candidatus Thorarchaeota archaeon]